jgi:flagellum-specific ATP synthase
MGGYHRGTDPDLDKAIELVPRILEVMKQSPMDPPSVDAFQEMAQALRAGAASAGQRAEAAQ